MAHENIGTNEWLAKAERSSLAHVLHNACLVNGTKVSVLYAIELMSESYKRILMHESEEELVLPTVISILTGCPDEQEKPLVRTVTSCYIESMNMMLWYQTDQYLEEGCI